MGKILILYDSLTGATEEMAKFVKEGAESFEGCQMSVRTTPLLDLLSFCFLLTAC